MKIFLHSEINSLSMIQSNLKLIWRKLGTLCSCSERIIFIPMNDEFQSEGSLHERLQCFFGGLPVLIGLKYFENLKELRVFGQVR